MDFFTSKRFKLVAKYLILGSQFVYLYFLRHLKMPSLTYLPRDSSCCSMLMFYLIVWHSLIWWKTCYMLHLIFFLELPWTWVILFPFKLSTSVVMKTLAWLEVDKLYSPCPPFPMSCHGLLFVSFLFFWHLELQSSSAALVISFFQSLWTNSNSFRCIFSIWDDSKT